MGTGASGYANAGGSGTGGAATGGANDGQGASGAAGAPDTDSSGGSNAATAGAGGSGGHATGGVAGLGASGSTAGGAGGVAGSAAGSGSAGAPAGGSGAVDPYASERYHGFCLPKGPAPADVPGAIQLVHSDDLVVRALATIGSYVYYMDGTLYRIDVASKRREQVLTSGFVLAIAGVGNDLYWVGQNASALYHVALDTLPATAELMLDAVHPDSFVLDGDYLYFRPRGATGYERVLRTSPDPASDVELIESDRTPTRASVSGGYAYFPSGTAMYRVPVTGGEPELIESLVPTEVISDGETLYFATRDELYKKPVHTLNNGSEWTALAIGNPILDDQANRWDILQLSLVGDRIYYREQSGALAWVKTDGSDCRKVADLYDAGNSTYSYGMDDQYIYALDHERDLWALPRDDR